MTFTLSPDQLDTLQEIINIGVGRAATMLNDMLDNHVMLSIPDVLVLTYDEWLDKFGYLDDEILSSVRLTFKGGFSGRSSLVFPPDSAAKLVSILTDSDLIGDADVGDLDELRTGVLTEVGNIVINGVMGSIGNMLSIRLDYSLPIYVENRLRHLLSMDAHDNNVPILIARTHFDVQELKISGFIYLIFEAAAFKTLVDKLDNLIESGQ